MSWDNWNNNNYDNHNDNHNDNQNNDNDHVELNDLLSEEDSFENDLSSALSDEDNTGDSLTESEKDENSSEKTIETEEKELNRYEKIRENFNAAPPNARRIEKFSERDIYTIENVLTVLRECSEIEEEWIETTLNVRGKSIKKAISIVEMDDEEFDSKVSAISALKTIYDAVNLKEGVDPADAIINAIARVDGMTDNDRDAMIKLAKKIAREKDGAKNIRANKSSSSFDVFSSIKEVMTGDSNISQEVVELGEIMELLKEASK